MGWANPPATKRSREDLPTPLGPVTSSASPAPTVKLKPRKTSRPPLMQARSDPTSRITYRPPAPVVVEATTFAATPPLDDVRRPRFGSGQRAEKSLSQSPRPAQATSSWIASKQMPYRHIHATTIYL